MKPIFDPILGKLRSDQGSGGGGGGYVLPPATALTLGGVKVGAGLSVASDGTISLAAPLAPVVVSDDPPALADGETADWYDPQTGVMLHLARVGGKIYGCEMTEM